MEDATSPATVTSCKDFADSVEHQQTLSLLDSLSTESMSTEWTDEKHSSYLKSMEASFVNQLYNSLDLRSSRSQKEQSSDAKSTRQMHSSTRVSSGQFKVLQGGSWGKINFERDGSQLDKADGSGALVENRWIRHFRSGSRHQGVTFPPLQEKVAFESQGTHIKGKKALISTISANSKQSYACHTQLHHHDSAGSNSEVSGQNFVDEDNEGNKTINVCSSKRMKTLVTTSSSNDQVVPFGSFPMTEDVTETRIFPESGRHRTDDWQSENKDDLQ